MNGGEAFARLRELFRGRKPDRPERLADPYFQRPEAKLAGIEIARTA